MKQFAVLLVALFAAPAFGQSTSVSRCVNHAGDLPSRTYIEGCTTPPCSLPQLNNAAINMEFRANRQLRSMRTLATAYLQAGLVSIPVDYDLGADANTCNFLQNTSCPVPQGQNVNYRLRMFIESFFPVGTSVTIEFRVVDQNNAPVVCIRVPIRITAPRSLPVLQ